MHRLRLYSNNMIEISIECKTSINNAMVTGALPIGDVEWAGILSKALFKSSWKALLENNKDSKLVTEQVQYIVKQIVQKNETGTFSQFVVEKVILHMAG